MQSMRRTDIPKLFTLGRILEGKEVNKALQLGESDLATHAVVVGSTGSGKSRAVTNLVLQHFEQGLGCCVLDPHGDTVEDVLAHLASRVVTSGSKKLLARV